jgi:hypothetical protein
MTSMGPGLRLWCPHALSGEHRPGDLFGIEAVGLSLHVPGLAIGLVDLCHLLAGGSKVSGKGSTEGSGALDPDRLDLAELSHPPQQQAIARRIGWELLVSERPALIVDRHRVVRELMGVDPADHPRLRRLCHAGIAPR